MKKSMQSGRTFSILASGVIWPKRVPKVGLPKRPKPVFGSYLGHG